MSSSRNRPVVDVMIHCPGSHGVIPDQVHRQASALFGMGIKVLLLCGPGFLRTRNAEYPVSICMEEGASSQNQGSAAKKLAKSIQAIRNQFRLAWEIYRHRPSIVLSASHIEMHAALWIWPHIVLALFFKTIYATNLHFSPKDKNRGGKWWSRLSSGLAFEPFRIAVAHKRISHPVVVPKFVRMVEVPIGPEKITPIPENVKKIRKSWNVPRGKKVFMAFGSIRNHKNLDLSIKALLDNPDAFLVVIGTAPSHKDRPIKYYQMLADDLGLSKRVFISDMFVHDEKRLSYFKAADFLLLTHAGTFHSQTSSLTTAVNARRRVLTSSGTSPMRDLVEHYGLGVFVEPDSSEAVADGMATLLHSELAEPNWEDYEIYATWETNVTRLIQASIDFINNRPTPQRQFEELEDEALPLPTMINARSLMRPRSERVKKSPVASRKPKPLPEPQIKTPPSAEIKTEKKRGRPPKAAQATPKETKVEASIVPAPPKKRGRKPKATIGAEVKPEAPKVTKAPAIITPEVPVKRGRKPKGSVAVSAKATEVHAKKVTATKAKATELTVAKKSPVEVSQLREVNHRRRTLRRRRKAADSSKN